MAKILPKQYRQLEYLQMPSQSWIDSGTFPQDVDTTYLEASITDTTASQYFLGVRNAYSVAIGYALSFQYHGGLNYYPCGWPSDGYAATADKKFTMTTYLSDSSDTSCQIDNNPLITQAYSGITWRTSNTPIAINALRAYNLGGIEYSGNNVKYYIIKMWRNNNLVREFIPAKRISDSVIGMYDLVSNTFFTNAGTGTFTAGPVIDVDVNVYDELEYIQSSGTQWIDTGIVPNNNTAWKTKFAYTDLNSNYNRALGVQQGVGNIIVLRSYATTGGKFFIESYSTVAKSWTSTSDIDYNPHTVVLNANGVFKFDDTVLTNIDNGISDTITETFTIGKNNGIAGGYASIRIYGNECKSNTTQNITQNLIPVRRYSDSEIGMVDTLTDTFYANAGTGTFIPGPSVNGKLYSVKKKCLLVNNPEWVVPEGYTQLQYIQSSSDAYIDTGFKPNQDTKWEYSFKCNNLTDSVMAGARTAYGSKMYILGCTQGGTVFGAGYGNTTSYPGVVTADLNNHIFIIDKNKWYFDGELRATMGTDTFQGDYNMYLFRGNNGGSLTNTCYQRVYYSKIYDNGTLVRNFIPAKNSDEVVGMYDLVNDQFYDNDGTGTFTAGPEIQKYTNIQIKQSKLVINNPDYHHIDGYTPLEYIKNGGQSYINTGVQGRFRVDMDMRIDDWYSGYSSNDCFYAGCYSSTGRNYAILYDSQWGIGIGTDNFSSEPIPVLNTWYHINASTLLNNGFLEVNGVRNITANTGTATENKDLYLFKSNGSDSGAKISTKQIKFYNNSNTLVRNFIPAKRNSDNVLGMYDLCGSICTLTGTPFYINAGTGTFTAGNEIPRYNIYNINKSHFFIGG